MLQVKQASVLFVECPIGAGFSYVDDTSYYNQEVDYIVDDLMELLRVFIKRTPIFQVIFCHLCTKIMST